MDATWSCDNIIVSILAFDSKHSLFNEYLLVFFFFSVLQGSFIPDGTLGPSEKTHDSRFGAAMSTLPDLNGDGFGELVVGAPLEDNHKGAIYLFYGQQNSIQPKYKQVRLNWESLIFNKHDSTAFQSSQNTEYTSICMRFCTLFVHF